MITDFISEVRKRGMARTNRYIVYIPFPTADNDTIKLASLFCESASLPGRNINTTAARTFGETREMPYERSYEPINLTFYVDTEMRIKYMFDKWMDMIVDPTRRTINYYDKFTRDMTVKSLTTNNQVPYVVNFFEAYPKTVSAIQLSSESKDVMKINVTMVYRYWQASLHSVEMKKQVEGTEQEQGAPITNLVAQSGQSIQDTAGVYTGVQSGQLVNLNYSSGVLNSMGVSDSTSAMSLAANPTDISSTFSSNTSGLYNDF